MGIPKFARFLMNRYPLIVKRIFDNRDIPEIDHLYLDINGIIHNVSHNNNIITSCTKKTADDIYEGSCNIIDIIFKLIHPQKLLMISADGVAPRAKMNQQRSRRFRKEGLTPEVIAYLEENGLHSQDMFNSDVISPGTEFMYNLSVYINKYIEKKKLTDQAWSDIQVLFTGSDVQGEGEHKILQYIRNYKTSSEYEKNTKICVYGLDADLIMLSLITHEPNIVILREDSFLKKKRDERKEKEREYYNKEQNKKDDEDKDKDPYEFIMVSVLREYLELEFIEVKTKIKFDFNIERIIDDFVYFCFFLGNDFLPNLNTMDIETGALDFIFTFYKECLPKLDDYITYHGKIFFNRAKRIFSLLSKQELTSLNEMLDKISESAEKRKNRKKELLSKMIKDIKGKKIKDKKFALFESIKTKGKEEINCFKIKKVKNKLVKLEELYIKKKKEKDPKIVFNFKEDINNYVKAQSHELETENGKNKIINRTLIDLFAGDDEEGPILENEEDKKINEESSLDEIIKESLKYSKYLNDDNYCSDLDLNDISNSDVSDVDENEIKTLAMQSQEYLIEDRLELNTNNVEDQNKVFHETLVNFYVKDSKKAKEFYYKEKLHIDINTPEGQKEKCNMLNKYLEGLQWVLFYYYRGVHGWRWYYPYHYAPMISDFDNYQYETNYEQMFLNDTSKPFDPFQSLIFILPKTSFDLLPKCYSKIPEEREEDFPLKFKYDYNGKRTSWESIVLLPFLDEKTIIELEVKYRQLSPEEEQRNKNGNTYLYYENIINKPETIKKIVYDIYQKSNSLLDSNYHFKRVDCSFPTLKTLDFDFSKDWIKQYYGKNLRKTKRILIYPILNEKIKVNQTSIEDFLFKKTIFVNYPYKSFGKLIGFVYRNQYYYLYNNQMYIDSNFKMFQDLIDKIVKDYLKKGISIEHPDILCNVVLFDKLGNRQGKTIKIYDEKNSFYVPYEITSLNSINKDFIEFKNHFYITNNLEKIDSAKGGYHKFIKGSKVAKEKKDDNVDKSNNVDKDDKGNNETNEQIFIRERKDKEEPKKEYTAKKIITKKFQVDKKFKTVLEGIEYTNDKNTISFIINKKNVSEYRQKRLFENEKLSYNQLYYYSSESKEKDKILENKNIIFKQIKI